MNQRTMGIDLGINAPSVAVVLDERGDVLVRGMRFEVTVEELARVERSALEGAPLGAKVHVVIEKTFPTCEFVSGFFSSRGHEVSFAKPDQVKEGRKFYSRKVKTDERDAYVLARLVYLDPEQLGRVHVAKPALRELKTLVSQRLSAIRQGSFLKNLLIRAAKSVWPGIATVFDSFDSAHARAFLRELDPDAAVELGEAGIAEFLRKHGQITHTQAKRLAERLTAVAKRAKGLLGLVDKTLWLELHRGHAVELLQQIESVEALLDAKEKQIEQCYQKADPEKLLTSIVGIGEITAPMILSYFGEPECFATTRKAQGFVGLYPETDASGQSDRKGTALSKKGPAYLRRDLFLVADSFRRHDPQGARLYYDQMVNKGKHHFSALCVVANRLVIPRVLAVLREKRPYELRDFDGKRIDKAQARELVAQFQVSEQERERLRSKLNPATTKAERASKAEKSRDRSPQVTSEREAPRDGRAARPEDPTKEVLQVTKAQLGMLVFRQVDQLLKSGGTLAEIRLALQIEERRFFQK